MRETGGTLWKLSLRRHERHVTVLSYLTRFARPRDATLRLPDDRSVSQSVDVISPSRRDVGSVVNLPIDRCLSADIRTHDGARVLQFSSRINSLQI